MSGPVRSSFSREVKAELLTLPLEARGERLLLGFSLMAAAKFSRPQIRFVLAYRPFVHYLRALLERHLGVSAALSEGKGVSAFTVEADADCRRLRAWLSEAFSFDASRGRLLAEPGRYSETERRLILRALFLSCGSLTEPSKAYHLEFSLRRLSVADFADALARGFDLRANLIKRYGYNILYLKDGQKVAEFLALIGAAAGMLAFEAGRVDKEMNNKVNRVVNCDSANARRIADSAARQIELLQRLEAEKGLAFLPDALREAAEKRLHNPGLSLSELGRLQSKPLGKSGMNHRLKKLEEIARQALCR